MGSESLNHVSKIVCEDAGACWQQAHALLGTMHDKQLTADAVTWSNGAAKPSATRVSKGVLTVLHPSKPPTNLRSQVELD